MLLGGEDMKMIWKSFPPDVEIRRGVLPLVFETPQ